MVGMSAERASCIKTATVAGVPDIASGAKRQTQRTAISSALLCLATFNPTEIARSLHLQVAVTRSKANPNGVLRAGLDSM